MACDRTAQQFDELLEFLQEAHGLDLKEYARSSLCRRIAERMREAGSTDFADYRNRLQARPEECFTLLTMGLPYKAAARRRAQERDRARAQLLALFSRKSARREYLGDVVRVIAEFSGCRCAGIRIVDGNRRIPYEATVGFSADFIELESMLSLDRDACACVRAVTGLVQPQEAPL